ncbi:zinc finger domain-containing protein [Streptomyces eurythermus]
MDLVRSWKRRVECPTCKTVAVRACRTGGGRPTNEHRARRDAVGPIPYEEWRKEGLIPEQWTYTIPAVLKESEKARADFNMDTALANVWRSYACSSPTGSVCSSRARKPWTASTTPCAS